MDNIEALLKVYVDDKDVEEAIKEYKTVETKNGVIVFTNPIDYEFFLLACGIAKSVIEQQSDDR